MSRSEFIVKRCWLAPGCKTVGEAINNSRLIEESGRFFTREAAEKWKRSREQLKQENFVFWIDEVVVADCEKRTVVSPVREWEPTKYFPPSTQQDGWCWPWRAIKKHYIKDGVSLCKRHVLKDYVYINPTEAWSSFWCKECARRLALIKRGGRE